MNFKQTGNVKVYLLVIALVVIGAAIMFLSDGMSPTAEDAAGTIVPAERYRANQIDSDDVVLGDETFAKFMQTDLYEELVQNPELIEVITDADVLAAFNDENMRMELNSNVQSNLNSNVQSNLNDNVQSNLNDNVQSNLNSNVQSNLNSANLQTALNNEIIRTALNNENIRAMLNSSAFQDQLNSKVRLRAMQQ
jgi:hypothetical protein